LQDRKKFYKQIEKIIPFLEKEVGINLPNLKKLE
jgi:hypothetical protein